MARTHLGLRRLADIRRTLIAPDGRPDRPPVRREAIRPGERFASLRDRLVRELSNELEAEADRRP